MKAGKFAKLAAVWRRRLVLGSLSCSSPSHSSSSSTRAARARAHALSLPALYQFTTANSHTAQQANLRSYLTPKQLDKLANCATQHKTNHLAPLSPLLCARGAQCFRSPVRMNFIVPPARTFSRTPPFYLNLPCLTLPLANLPTRLLTPYLITHFHFAGQR